MDDIAFLLTQSDFSAMRSSAASVLGMTGHSSAVKVLAQFLADEDVTVRQAVVKALGFLHYHESRDLLLQSLHDDYVPARVEAINGLGAYQQDAEVLEQLCHILTNDASEDARSAATLALGKIGDPKSIPYLVQALVSDTDPNVQIFASRSICQIQSSLTVSALVQAILHTKDSIHQPRIKNMIWSLGELAIPEARLSLIHLIASMETELRAFAIVALSQFNCVEDSNFIIQLLQDPSHSVRASAAAFLGKCETPSARKALIDALHDKHAHVRAAAVKAMGISGNSDLIPYIMPMLSDPDMLVRLSAIQSIGMLPTPEAIQIFAAIIMNSLEPSFNRTAAIIALGNIHVQESCDVLLRLMREPDLDMVFPRLILGVLKNFADMHIIDVILQYAHDDDADLRVIAIRSLGELHQDAELDALLQATYDRDEWVRATAIYGLVHYHDPVIQSTLLRLYSDPAACVRIEVIKALRIGDIASASDVLLQTLADIDRFVREQSLSALSELHPEALDALIPEATDILRRKSPWLSPVLGAFARTRISQRIESLRNPPQYLCQILQSWYAIEPFWQAKDAEEQALATMRQSGEM